MKEKNIPFPYSDMIIIFEAAIQTLGDAVAFDELADFLDVDDKELIRIREELHKFMRHENGGK